MTSREVLDELQRAQDRIDRMIRRTEKLRRWSAIALVVALFATMGVMMGLGFR